VQPLLTRAEKPVLVLVSMWMRPTADETNAWFSNQHAFEFTCSSQQTDPPTQEQYQTHS